MPKKKKIRQNIKTLLDRMPGNTVDLKKQLADELNITTATVHRWYSDDSKVIDPENYVGLCNFFKVDLSEIVKVV